ncbi:MAG: hypothetical protein WCL44_07315 [bacterium]
MESTQAELVLPAVACSLLDRQIAAKATALETEGGFTERLHRVRYGNRSLSPAQSTKSTASTSSTHQDGSP